MIISGKSLLSELPVKCYIVYHGVSKSHKSTIIPSNDQCLCMKYSTTDSHR
jgi:hypothetical protein